VAADAAKAAARLVQPGGDPADEHVPITPPAHVADEVATRPLRFSIALVLRSVR
jgi:hypothetical protein